MSVKVMGGVWDLALDPSAKFVLLALADHADHEGRNAHPSVKLLAKKTGYSERNIQYILRALQDQGLIEPTGDTAGGRGRAVHYAIHLEKGATLAPIEDQKGANSDTERVQIATQKGAMLPRARVDKTLTIKEPSLRTGGTPLPPKPKAAPYTDGFDEFYESYPRHEDRKKALAVWQRIKPDADLLAVMLDAIAAQRLAEKDRQYIPHPTTWLNGERWKDDPAPIASPRLSPNGFGPKGPDAAYFAAKARELERQGR